MQPGIKPHQKTNYERRLAPPALTHRLARVLLFKRRYSPSLGTLSKHTYSHILEDIFQ